MIKSKSLDKVSADKFETSTQAKALHSINFLKISKNFLASTNIMIWDDWNPYMVDVCESADSRLQWKIKNLLAKPFIKRTISNLEETLQKRIAFENINKELLDTLEK